MFPLSYVVFKWIGIFASLQLRHNLYYFLLRNDGASSVVLRFCTKVSDIWVFAIHHTPVR